MQISSVSREIREGTENNRESLWFLWCFIDSEIDRIVLNSWAWHLIEMWRRSETKDLLKSRHVRGVLGVGIELVALRMEHKSLISLSKLVASLD